MFSLNEIAFCFLLAAFNFPKSVSSHKQGRTIMGTTVTCLSCLRHPRPPILFLLRTKTTLLLHAICGQNSAKLRLCLAATTRVEE